MLDTKAIYTALRARDRSWTPRKKGKATLGLARGLGTHQGTFASELSYETEEGGWVFRQLIFLPSEYVDALSDVEKMHVAVLLNGLRPRYGIPLIHWVAHEGVWAGTYIWYLHPDIADAYPEDVLLMQLEVIAETLEDYVSAVMGVLLGSIEKRFKKKQHPDVFIRELEDLLFHPKLFEPVEGCA